jgi:ribosomal peptide maturation radical SAM protein 1
MLVVDICFIVMPFVSVSRPAIGVSLLKAAMIKIGVSAKVHYFNLKFAEKIGLDLHSRLAETGLDSPLIGELIFSPFVFQMGQRINQNMRIMINEILDSKQQDDRQNSSSSIDKLIEEIISVQDLIPGFLDRCAYEILNERPKIVGFSSTFEQNCASLALAKKIKEHAEPTIIFGGANCEGDMGSSLLKCAPWVDFVCSGEGDIAFVDFVKFFMKSQLNHKINGIITRQSSSFDISLTNPVMDINSLPFPDYDDFFAAISNSALKEDLDPELVIETSRGCWWGEKFQCTFCGLNGSTMKYRSKSITHVLDELKYLTHTYKIKKFQVVDNIMDMNYIEKLFPQIYSHRIDVNLFYETKANISKKQLLIMKQAGVNVIQPGIESLSDGILSIMKKGVTALQNIQLLKWCKEIGIIPLWNLIWGFPGEPKEEYDRMAKLVPLLLHLQPPSGFGKIVLDRFSPYFVEPLQNGIMNIRPWIAYKFLYPLQEQDLQKMAYHFDFDYVDGRNPDAYTKELEQRLIYWKNLWIKDDGNNNRRLSPSLNTARIGDAIMINDTRPSSIQRFHLLANEEAKVFELCETMHNFNSIFIRVKEEYPTITEEGLRHVLLSLIDKKVMICDNKRYLSLAIALTPSSPIAHYVQHKSSNIIN